VGAPLTDQQLIWFAENTPWFPQDGPQTQAYDSPADLLLYGGAAGGGKTALAVGLAVCEHRETLFIRREATQLGAVVDEISTVNGGRDGFNGQDKIFRLKSWDGVQRKIVLGSTPHNGDETKYQGRARDLLVVDEAANMLESQVHFLKGWVRSTVPGQRCRTLLCSNPPTSAEGAWLLEWFAPWLDKNHPLYPHPPGELLWYAFMDGKEAIVAGPEPFLHNGERVIPQSRTFIPAKVTDNAYLRDTGYVATLQALPEPLRSQMLYGDFTAGQDDNEWQVIPSEWVEIAMKRWEAREFVADRITSAGVDPSRGGRDDTVMAYREDWYYHELDVYPGHVMKSGGDVCAKVVERVGSSRCPVHVDVIGIGASAVDHLVAYIDNRTIPINAAAKTNKQTDWSGTLKFVNERARLWWQFRDLLNPANGRKVALPPNQRLKSELCAPRYKMRSTGVQIEAKDDIITRLGRSTDYADAVIMAAERTPVITSSGNFVPPVNVKRHF
jgi:hypothetical protein